MVKHVLCIALVLLVPVACIAEGEKVLLQYGQPAGEIYRFKFQLDGTTEFAQSGKRVKGEEEKPNTIVAKKELDSSVEVVSRSEGKMDIVFRFGKGSTRVNKFGEETEESFDFSGKDIKIKMLANGKAEVENMATLDSILQEFGAPYIEEPLFLVLPDKPVEVGATWEQEFTRRGFRIQKEAIKFTVQYELAGIEEFKGYRCAVIKAKGSVKLKDYPGKNRKGRKVVILKADEEITGVVHFALDLGIPVEFEKKIKSHAVREWETYKEGKEPYRDELTTEVTTRNSLVGTEKKTK